jgi:hypothetical protein
MAFTSAALDNILMRTFDGNTYSILAVLLLSYRAVAAKKVATVSYVCTNSDMQVGSNGEIYSRGCKSSSYAFCQCTSGGDMCVNRSVHYAYPVEGRGPSHPAVSWPRCVGRSGGFGSMSGPLIKSQAWRIPLITVGRPSDFSCACACTVVN